MKSKRELILALIGAALLASPVSVLAADHRHYVARPAYVLHGNAAPVRTFAHAAPIFRPVASSNLRTWGQPLYYHAAAAPVWNNWPHREWVANQASVPCASGAPTAYAPPTYYNAPVATSYAGGPCANVQRLETQYWRDRNTGHPAAANSLLRQMRGAENRCGGDGSGAASYGGLPSIGTLGQYQSYGNYNNPYTGYGNGMTTLAPFVQQFIR